MLFVALRGSKQQKRSVALLYGKWPPRASRASDQCFLSSQFATSYKVMWHRGSHIGTWILSRTSSEIAYKSIYENLRRQAQGCRASESWLVTNVTFRDHDTTLGVRPTVCSHISFLSRWGLSSEGHRLVKLARNHRQNHSRSLVDWEADPVLERNGEGIVVDENE